MHAASMSCLTLEKRDKTERNSLIIYANITAVVILP